MTWQFKVTHDYSFRLLFFSKVPECSSVSRYVYKLFAREEKVQHVWNNSRPHAFPGTLLPEYVGWWSSQNHPSPGLLTQGNLGKFWVLFYLFVRFLRKFCTLGLNYFIIWFLLLRFTLFIMNARNPEIRIHVWNARTFIPAVLPPKGQELQTTDNEL